MIHKFIIANWKTYLTHSNALSLVEQIYQSKNIIIAPSMIQLALIKEHFPTLNLASQDVSGQAVNYGAYTGETPAQMLTDMGIKYAIIGHSERKKMHLDNYKSISAKISNCITSSITPIICIGETKEERDNGKYLDIIKTQIVNLHISSNSNIIIAYEPIWAIGTGISPSLDEIKEIMNLIRSTLNIARQLVLVYGGSVNAENAKDIVNIEGVDGLLIGKASTDFKHFKSIIDIIR